ncbi:hypothetical protein G7046_g5197 [Stylonectria norvegica]|nr:hypothetical protein G7046_g5197 [Stylonectria norvegica]
MTTMALRFPPIFLLPTHLGPDELHHLEDKIASLTYDINEAEIVLGNISRPERAKFELRRYKVETEPVMQPDQGGEVPAEPLGTVKVLKLAWLTDSMDKGTVLPMAPYMLYEGRKTLAVTSSKVVAAPSGDILKRAIQDQSGQPALARTSAAQSRYKGSAETHKSSHPQRPSLIHQTTSEHDMALPLIPDFLKTTYSCQRPTPINPPNEEFVEHLKKIRTIRLLHGDPVGVRAYSTSIATLAAYPSLLQNAQEVSRLPGCGAKIAELYQQWSTSGFLKEAHDADTDDVVSVLNLFYDIWGVGDTTAREFYRKGYRDLDDLVEHGWESLSRVQQIGVKYYDEFLLKIPRPEVESIGAIVLAHARSIDPDFEMIVVGGYRRGKRESGDVDVLLSHRDEAMTINLVEKLVLKLEKARLITHTLVLSTKNSERGQAPVSWKGESNSRGSGFDTLDKALVVWQDPNTEDAPHRRVDLIVSPWKTVGCAVLGWSGGTTFQRDVRRYCKKEKAWKFDSSGVRSRADGKWVDLEGSSAGDRRRIWRRRSGGCLTGWDWCGDGPRRGVRGEVGHSEALKTRSKHRLAQLHVPQVPLYRLTSNDIFAMTLTIEFPENYGFVLVAATSTFFVNTLHQYLTSKYRKASGLKYPIPYASNEDAAKDPKAYQFNCAQRAHGNFTENHTSFLGALLISGLRFPVPAAVLGAGWVLSRTYYAVGYASGGPAGRTRGSMGSFLFDTILKFTAAYAAVMFALGQ